MTEDEDLLIKRVTLVCQSIAGYMRAEPGGTDIAGKFEDDINLVILKLMSLRIQLDESKKENAILEKLQSLNEGIMKLQTKEIERLSLKPYKFSHHTFHEEIQSDCKFSSTIPK